MSLIHKLHNILIWSINFVFWTEPKLPWLWAKVSLLKCRLGYWIMDGDRLHNSSTFSSMAEHISPDALHWCCGPVFTQETSPMSPTITVPPSVAVSISATARIVFWNDTNASLGDAYTFNSIMFNRNALHILQTPSPELKWARKEIANYHNSSYGRIVTIIPSCWSTPTPTSHTDTDRYFSCFHIFIIWKTAKTF